MPKYDIYKSGGLLIKNRKLLLERSGGKNIYVVPGGRIEPGESPKDTLVRELQEEFKITTNQDDFEYLGTYIVKNAKITDSKVKIETYLVKDWIGDIQIDNEIEGIDWIDSSNSQNLTIGPFASEIVLPMLKARNLID